MQGFGSSSKNVGKKKVPFGGLHNGSQSGWIWRLLQQDRGFLGSKIHLSPHALLLV